jgi:hypothetical protein
MLERTTRTTVTFAHPFSLRSVDLVQPAGTYVVETDEELIHGMSFDAYRRTATFLYLPAKGAAAIATEVVNIDPAELSAALAADAAALAVSADTGVPPSPEA